MDKDQLQSPEKVAVIAVHGVGRQKNRETAQAISDMIGRVTHHEDPVCQFEPFVENNFTIHVEQKWETGNVEEMPQDIRFSAEAINKLKASDKLSRYETTSFQSSATRNGKISQLSVFELYWNDLSHAPGSFTKFLAELYQVYFHLASLGHKAVRFTSEKYPANRWARWMHCCHCLMQFLLPSSIPILNLFLLATTLPVAVLAIPDDYRFMAAAATLFVITTFLSIRLLLRKYPGKAGIALSLTAGLCSAGLAYRFQSSSTFLLMAFALAAGLFAACFGSRKLLERYEHPYVKFAPAFALFITMFLLYFGAWRVSPSGAHGSSILLGAAAISVSGNFLLLQIAWFLTFLLSLPIIAGPLVQRILSYGAEDSAVRALQTGRIGMMLSANLFFLTTVILWAALLDYTQPILCTLTDFTIDIPHWMMHRGVVDISGDIPIYVLSDNLYTLTVGNGGNAYLGLILLALSVVAVGILPAALSEGKLPKTASPGRVRGLASWLNGAFSSFRLAEWLLIGGWFVLAFGYVCLLPKAVLGSEWLKTIGVLLAASIPALLFGRKLLPKGISQVLDILLDVSNWLKERPFNTNPRGQILVRYLSMLKHIAASGYERIIIVAHSQGTVISADCLRLLEQSSELRKNVFPGSQPAIELITAGSPLRQLYRERFPLQYGWVVSENIGPDISSLSLVRHWLNFYRSGDYVGRTLWCEPEPENMLIVKNSDTLMPVPKTGDFCVGLGAHLHYFDGSPNVVGTVVSELICNKH